MTRRRGQPRAGRRTGRIHPGTQRGGQTFLIIEHDMPFIMDLADPVIVLDQGKVLVEGTPEAVRSDERVIDAYLGGPAE